MKKFRGFKKSAAIGLISILTLSNAAFGSVAFAQDSGSVDKLLEQSKTDRDKVQLTQRYNPHEKVRVVVELEGEPAISVPTKKGIRYKDLPEKTKNQLQSEVKEEQSDFISDVKKENIDFKVQNTFTTVVNGLSGEVEFGQIEELEKIPNVESVSVVNEYERPKEKPDMLSSKDMVEAIQTWNTGYNGEGMVVGIIDTGIDPNHKDMKLSDASKAKLTQTKVGELKSTGNLPGKYYTAKVPYGYNYADKNSEIMDLGPDATMHGMHVAGTVGANGDETKDGIKGVAPEAQLLALKVFGNDPAMPSTFGDTYIKAIDDGIILGADVLNMSLGSTAGFVDSESLEQKAIDRAVNNGVLMSLSAGNSAQMGDGHANPLATNPDIGLVGSPGLSTNSISVASIENTKISIDEMKVKVGDETLTIGYKKQSSPDPLEIFGTTAEKDVVYVGDGSPAQYKGKDVNGKVVFAVRNATNPNYGEIQKQAEAAGAAGVIIRGHVSHGDYVSMALNSPTIPLVSLSISDGNALETKIKAAGGGKVTFTGKTTQVANSAAGTMATTSSWGVTPSLELKPEITAPGGQIYSTFNDNKYGLMSGTSMAAPHVSGGAALVLQRIKELFPDLHGADLVKRTKTILMNTAKIVKDKNNGNIPYSPRLQGAGIMQLHSAVSTPVYVVNKGTQDGKIELKEIKDDIFYLTVTATNFSDKDMTYNVNASVLTDAVSGSQIALKENVISKAKVIVDKPKITLFAGASSDITVKVDLSNAKADLEKLMKNGYFVEGFITLSSDDQNNPLQEISVPYVGFKGDWNKPPVLDAMKYDSGSFYGVSGMVDDLGYYMGADPFTGKYNKNYIAISPNGDGENDGIAPVLSFLRNSKTVEYAITDANGKKIRTLRTDKEQRKNYDVAKGKIYTYKPYYTLWDGYAKNQLVEDGLYYYQVKTQVDLAGKEQQVTKIPVVVDNTNPVVTDISYSKKNGTLAFSADDGNIGSGLQYVDIYINGELLGSLNPNGKKSYQAKVNVGSVEDGGSIEVVAYDYANNHAGVAVSSPGDNTIPYIISDIPEALGVYDTRVVPVSGYVLDSSRVTSLTIKGDKLQGSPVNLNPVYDEKTKRWNFGSQLTFTADGIHNIYFAGEDAVGNKIEFERKIIVDTEGPTLDVKGLPENNFVAAGTENPEITVNVKDNFDDIRLLIDQDEVYTNAFDEPFVQRPLDYDYKYTPDLKEGRNDIVIEAEDLAGHKVKKTITIYKGKEGEQAAPSITSFSVTPDNHVSKEQPAHISAKASESITWDAKVIDPSGKEITLESSVGDTYEADFTPDTLAVNGKYTLKLKSADGNDEYTTTFNVINYPLSIDGVKTINAAGNEATTFKQNTVIRINADLKNSGKTAVNPTVIVQVKDAEGAVVYFAEANNKSINSGTKNRYSFDITLENFEKGSYTAEVFAWDQMDNPIPLVGKSTSKTYNVN
ncbi:S8 family serine peptidase [Heyndrickxia vini]|uniref:S8 family serine peptidase n=1 Tax=Heyndrickxia vini TaxID=1476025 RepID=A0ABX7E5Y7_9BACI|nr:S8 family serine peptidase [Heyndrickxia vini]QQZ10197.1 S8 family serine peptidase [Heyndrickxia vini]